MMELIDDDKDRNDDKNLINNSRKEKGYIDFFFFDINNDGGDIEILSQIIDDFSEFELELGRLVLKKVRIVKK